MADLRGGSTVGGKQIATKPYVDGTTIPSSDAVTTPIAGKLLRLNSSGLLPASVTGNAGTATVLQTARNIALSGDASGLVSFNGSTNVTINTTLANSGVTAGTYTKVTVDAKGRVTSATNQTAADIPNLDWSKITSGKPTTLAGYGITDAVTKSGGAYTGFITLHADPASPMHAVTKQYVDGAIQGIRDRKSVRAATTANITLSGTQTIDGVALAVGNMVLVKNQTTATQNGIYVVATGGWTRHYEYATGAVLDSGTFVFVEEGNTHDNTGWMLATNGAITIGVTPLTWVQFSGAGSFNGDNTTITRSGNVFSQKSGVVTAGTYTKVTVDTYGRVTGGSGMSAGDIPNLDWNKITSGKPTTLSGYGITDAMPKSGGSFSGWLAAPSIDTPLLLAYRNRWRRQYLYNTENHADAIPSFERFYNAATPVEYISDPEANITFDMVLLNADGSIRTGYDTKLTTWVYVSVDTVIDTSLIGDDKTLFLLNGVELARSATSTIAVPLNFTIGKGWNQIDILHHQGLGGSAIRLSKKLSSLVTYMTAIDQKGPNFLIPQHAKDVATRDKIGHIRPADGLSISDSGQVWINHDNTLLLSGTTPNKTLGLRPGVITAGTYTKVTVDQYGRAISGTNLAAGDIPNLDWSKITSGKPTTLSGYGITDAVRKTAVYDSANIVYNDVLSHRAGKSTNIGMIKIKLPMTTWTSTMVVMHVTMYSYSRHYLTHLILSGYADSESSKWINTRAHYLGNNHGSVRFGTDGTGPCIFIGGIDTSWGWNHVAIDKVYAYHSKSQQNFLSGTTVDYVASEAGITFHETPVVNAGMFVDRARGLQTARNIALSGHMTGSAAFDGLSNVTIATTLANSGVTAGTYTKVTVDAKGRVTTATNQTAADIPNLDWSKITSGKPTTLSGYGITDATPSSHTSGKASKTVLGHIMWADGLNGDSTGRTWVSVDEIGITMTGTSPNRVVAHKDTSDQASVTNTGGTVIQSIGVDGFGHVTSLASKAISAADVGAVPTTGGTMTGILDATLGVRIGGASIIATGAVDHIKIQGITNIENGGIVFGSAVDTSIYRQAAKTLKTDAAFKAQSVTINEKARMEFNATENSIDFVFI